MIWNSWFATRWLGASSVHRKLRHSPLMVEILEDRSLLSVGLGGFVTPEYIRLHPLDSAGPLGTPGPNGYSPSQLRHGYGFDQISFNGVAGDGRGQTIAIIDAYDEPNIASDLQQFDRQFGLPDPVFTKVNQTGGSVLPPANSSWGPEIALDVEWAHAMAPGAKILLVEADNGAYSNLTAAVAYAARQPGVAAVSMSWGGGEFSSEASFDSSFNTPAGHSGVTFVGASGDSGAPMIFPAVSPNILAVGGTTLRLDSSGNYQSEQAWGGSGGGLSVYQSQPSYQKGVVTQTSTQRAGPDVSFNADPGTGFPVYDSYDNGAATPWAEYGGTSASAPPWAALIAIADQGRAAAGQAALDGRSQTLPMLYALPASDFHDITSGSSTGTPSYPAGAGFDLATGRGTPIANLVVAGLVGTPVTPPTTPPPSPPPTPPPTGTSFSDSFSTTSLSSAWSLHGGTWVEQNGVLSQTNTSNGDPKKAMVTDKTYPANLQVTARVRVDSWSDGDMARAGIGLFTDPTTGAGYNLVFHSVNGVRKVQFLDDHVAWGSGINFNFSVGTFYWFKMQMVNGVLSGKVWQDGTAEPTAWMLTQSGWTDRSSGAPSLNGGSAYSGQGSSSASFDDVTVTGSSASTLGAPTGLTASAVSGSQINLAWNSVVGATAYQVQRSMDGVSGWTSVGSPTGTTFQNTGLTGSTKYFYQVVATSGSSSSPASNIANATTASTTSNVLFMDAFTGSSLSSAWSQHGGTWVEQNGVLSQTNTSNGDPKKAIVTDKTYPANLQVTARVRVDSWNDGDMARAGIGLFTDPTTGAGYNLVFHSVNGVRKVQFLDDHVAWGSGVNFNFSVGTFYWFKIQIVNGVLSGKVWQDGTAEPTGWMLTQSGWTDRSSGAPSLNGGSAYSGQGSSTASFGNVTVTGL